MRKGIQRVFSEVARTYELANHVLTFGMDIHWRKIAAKEAALSGGSMWLDVCSGTGEMARNLSVRADENTDIFAVDFSYTMLARAKKKNRSNRIHICLADVSHLPFPDSSFDIVTLSFATRNLNVNKDILVSHLKEISRILKVGGRLINLETSQPRSRIIRALFHLYVQVAVKPVGYFISRSKVGYSYLSYTIPRYYSPKEFKAILKKSGFNRVHYKPLFFGIAAIHTAVK